MGPPPPIVDGRIHPGGLSDQDLLDLAFFGVRAAVAVAGGDVPEGSADELLDWLDALITLQATRMRAAGIAPFFAPGIPARRLPQTGFAALLEQIPTLFERGNIVGLGGIGLHVGGRREEEAFLAQLELAISLDLPVIVDLPAEDRAPLSRRTLLLLQQSGIQAERVLVGGVDLGTWRLVRACGFTAGVTVHPSKLRPEDAVRLVEQQGAAGIVLGSGAGEGPSDLLALPRTLHLLERAGISQKIARRVARDNAIDFFGIDRTLLPHR